MIYGLSVDDYETLQISKFTCNVFNTLKELKSIMDKYRKNTSKKTL